MNRKYIRIFTASLVLYLSVGALHAQQTRTVTTPLEYGLYYAFPPNPSECGMLVLNPHSGYFSQLPATSIKGPHGHLQHFAPARPDDDFPYQDLKNIEAQQVAAGGPPIFITATYASKKRPVYFSWHLRLNGFNKPTADPSLWSQAVNLRDKTFIDFFVNNYLKMRMFQNPPAPPIYYWLAADNCAFDIGLYGVLDDAGVFHSVNAFDPPFALSASDFLDSIVDFLGVLRSNRSYSDIHIIGNEGDMSDESRFAQVWGGFDGSIREDLLQSFQGDTWSRSHLAQAYDRCQFLGPNGKACLLRCPVPSHGSAAADRLRASYVAYLICRGPNFFFGPVYDDHTNDGVPPSSYQPMQMALGLPVANASYTYYDHGDGTSGWRLYQRQTEHGIVYLNWSGASRTVVLPAGNTYHDRNGRAVTTLTIADLSGDYVTTP